MSLLDTASLIVTPNAYKEGKLYSVIPSDGSGDMSVTRATTATRVNSAGLVELVPYNLLEYSQDFSNAYWVGETGNTITSNTTTAPDGTLTADTFTATASNELNVHNLNGLTLANGTFTYSVYLKNNGTNLIEAYLFKIGIGFAARGEINFSAGTFTASIGTGSIENVGNGWFRVSLTNTYTSGFFTTGTYTTSTTGTRSVFAWGAQLVEGSTALPYQKTETRLNIPRLDYSNGTCPSLLVEPQRTNLNLYSSDITNAVWETQNGVGGASVTRTANYGIAPDGTMSADRLQLNKGTSGYAEIYQYPISITNGATYTFSAYVKSLSGNVSFLFGFNGSAREIENATTEWTRITWTTTAVGTVGAAAISLVDSYDPNTSASVDLLVWGFQVEAGSYATSYIPTTSASVTRNADVISKTGISSLIGQTEGTLFFDYNKTHASDEALLGMTYLNANPSNNRLQIVIENNYFYMYATNGGTLALLSGNINLLSGRNKIAISYGSNGYKIYLNGISAYTNVSTITPSTDSFRLGSYATNVAFMSDSFNASALWETQLTNAQLAQLTTI